MSMTQLIILRLSISLSFLNRFSFIGHSKLGLWLCEYVLTVTSVNCKLYSIFQKLDHLTCNKIPELDLVIPAVRLTCIACFSPIFKSILNRF